MKVLIMGEVAPDHALDLLPRDGPRSGSVLSGESGLDQLNTGNDTLAMF